MPRQRTGSTVRRFGQLLVGELEAGESIYPGLGRPTFGPLLVRSLFLRCSFPPTTTSLFVRLRSRTEGVVVILTHWLERHDTNPVCNYEVNPGFASLCHCCLRPDSM